MKGVDVSRQLKSNKVEQVEVTTGFSRLASCELGIIVRLDSHSNHGPDEYILERHMHRAARELKHKDQSNLDHE